MRAFVVAVLKEAFDLTGLVGTGLTAVVGAFAIGASASGVGLTEMFWTNVGRGLVIAVPIALVLNLAAIAPLRMAFRLFVVTEGGKPAGEASSEPVTLDANAEQVMEVRIPIRGREGLRGGTRAMDVRPHHVWDRISASAGSAYGDRPAFIRVRGFREHVIDCGCDTGEGHHHVLPPRARGATVRHARTLGRARAGDGRIRGH